MIVVAVKTIAKPRDAVFDFATSAEGLCKCFTGYAVLIPGIKGVEMIGGAAPSAEAMRWVKLSDGSKIKERIIRFDRPSVHSYDMAEMNFLQKLMCSNMISEWTFEELSPNETRVTWRYEIVPKGRIVRPLVKVVGSLFEKAMARCLENINNALRLGPQQCKPFVFAMSHYFADQFRNGAFFCTHCEFVYLLFIEL